MPIDRAATLRNAEALLRQGKIEPAIVEYLRILDEQPNDWTTANTVGDLYVRAGQTEKAVDQFLQVADGLKAGGFRPKASAVYKKILKLNPDQEHALLQSADIAAEQGLYADARAYLSTVLARRQARGDQRGVADARIRLGNLDPNDYDARLGAAVARAEIGDGIEAVGEMKEIARELVNRGRRPEAIKALRQAVHAAPEDDALRAQLVDLFVQTEDFAGAREFAATVPQLCSLAEALDLRGRHDEALEILHDADWLDPNDTEMKAHLAHAMIVRGDFDGAAQMLTADQESTAGAAGRIAALARVAGLCADAGLDTALARVQAWLADAYLEDNQPAEARAVAEDLLTREPHEGAHVERLRRVLVLMNEPDPDRVIAARLRGEPIEPDVEPAPAIVGGHAAAPVADTPAAQESSPPGSAHAIDIERLLAELDEPSAPVHAESDSVEVDLSIVLDTITSEAEPQVSNPTPTPASPPAPLPAAASLDDVFAQMRNELAHSPDAEPGEYEYARALALKEAGDVDGCMTALEAAARAPDRRFAAASMLARLLKERGMTAEALEWFERAASATPPTADEYHELLFELAEALEAAGETARALAICLELQADAGAYRDVDQRVDRLVRVQPRG